MIVARNSPFSYVGKGRQHRDVLTTISSSLSSISPDLSLFPVMEEPSVSTEKEECLAEDVFVDDLPEYLKCPICLCCLSNPYQVVSLSLASYCTCSRHQVDYLYVLHVYYGLGASLF